MDEIQLVELVTSAQAGDRDAFGSLAQHFEPVVFSIVLRRLRNRSEAVEITQDVFMQALRKLPQLREPERFAGWLRRIAVRMSINRAVRRPNETAQDPEHFGGLTSDDETPFDALLKSEAAEQVRDGLMKLRDLDRETLLAFYFKGQSLKEMSDEFNSPVGTIKRRLHMARNRLKEHLLDLQPA